MKHLIMTHTLLALLIPGFGLCLGTGCTREALIDPPVSGELAEVSFFASALTRADNTGPLEKDAQVRVYVYHNKTGVTTPMVDPKDYKANTAGDALEAVAPPVTTSVATESGTGDEATGTAEATAMFLPSGSFNFYAVSTYRTPPESSPDMTLITVPTFDTTANDGKPFMNQNSQGTDGTKGVATGLKNGIDYLHARQENQQISFGTASQSVALNFQHVTTQVRLTIKFSATACAASDEAASNFANAKVFIQQTDVANAYMRLADGMLRFANNTETEAVTCGTDAGNLVQDQMLQMTVAKETGSNPLGTIPANQVATCCMMPLKAATGQEMWIKVVIEGLKVGNESSATTHTYTGKLNASNGWLAGKSNRYTLTLSGTEIAFSGVSVTDWGEGGSGGEVGNLEDNSASTAGTN